MINDGNAAAAFGDLAHKWKWLLALGILLVVGGVAGISMAVALTLVSVTLYGVMLLVAGIIQAFQTFHLRRWDNIVFHGIIAGLYIVAGFVVIRNPVLASSLFTLLLAGTMIAIGMVRIVIAFRVRGTNGWLFALVGGVFALALGIMIMSHWPASGLVVIGLFVAIELIANGWTCIAIALAARNTIRVRVSQ